MQVRFLGQGLCEGNDKPVGNELGASIADPKFSHLEIYAAFLSAQAAEFLVKNIAASTGLNAILFVGVDLQGTSKEALEFLLNSQGVQAYVFYTSSPPIYHPKIYVFKGANDFRVIIGSSNLTASGLFSNIEASACIDFAKNDIDGKNFLKQLDTFFKPIVGKKANVQALTQATIDELHAANIVPTEAQQLANRKKASTKVLPTSGQGLAALFPPRKTTQNPLAKKKVAQPTMAATIQNPPNDVTSSTSTNSQGQQITNKFWIETGALTSGSRNQLDLSVVSVYNRLPHGSLALFGVNHSNTSIPTTITIRYQGIDYYNNNIKYPKTSVGKTNGTWRLQMSGKSQSKDKLSTHSKAMFIRKVLVFTKLATNHYEVTVYPLGQLSTYKTNSVLWDQNRPKSKGRHFGQL